MFGPYAGVGLEQIIGGGSAIGVEARGHFFFGSDMLGTPLDGGALQVLLTATSYW